MSALLESPVPAIVWVAPSGGRAASAGTFITLAANLAYMAPGTNIGAASPVGSGGEDLTGTIGEKVENDAIANIRSVAETRGRNVDWAVSTVDKAVSVVGRRSRPPGRRRRHRNVDRGRAPTGGWPGRHGRSQPVTIDIADAPLVDLPMNPFQSFIHLLSDPNVAFILLTLGFYGLLFEVQSPNFVTGIVGAIALVLAFIGFGSLPLNVAGLLLILLAIVLFVLEFTVTSHGLLAIGGLICFVLGAFTLYTAPGSPTAPDVTVATPLILGMAIATACTSRWCSRRWCGPGGGAARSARRTAPAAATSCRRGVTPWSRHRSPRSAWSTLPGRSGPPGRPARSGSPPARTCGSSARKG